MANSQNTYILGPHVGSGGSGHVFLAYHSQTNEKCVCKIVDKKNIECPEDFRHICDEINVLKQLDHPHIVKYIDFIETPTSLQIYMEYCEGQPLIDYLNSRDGLGEYQTWIIFQQILSVVDYIHSKNIVHRDLKPENIIIDDSSNITVIDFGLCSVKGTNTLLDTFCGSIFYIPPECIKNQPYDGSKSDIWAIGVILYALRAGILPWKSKNLQALVNEIVYDTIIYPQNFSQELVQLLNYILTKDPNFRPTAVDISKNSWVIHGPIQKMNKNPMFTSLPNVLSTVQLTKFAKYRSTSNDFIKNPTAKTHTRVSIQPVINNHSTIQPGSLTVKRRNYTLKPSLDQTVKKKQSHSFQIELAQNNINSSTAPTIHANPQPNGSKISRKNRPKSILLFDDLDLSS